MSTINAKLAANMWKLDVLLGLSPAKNHMCRITSYRKIIYDFFFKIEKVKFSKEKQISILPSKVREYLINNFDDVDKIYNEINRNFTLYRRPKILLYEKSTSGKLELAEDFYKTQIIIKIPVMD